MGRVVGVDYGTKRLGFAVSDETGCIAFPLCTIEVASVVQSLAAVRRILVEQNAARVVLGLPLNMDGTRGPAADSVYLLAHKLEGAGVIVSLWDERLTTRQVDRMLIDSDTSRSRRRDVRDKLAAQIILQSYLDSVEVGGE